REHFFSLGCFHPELPLQTLWSVSLYAGPTMQFTRTEKHNAVVLALSGEIEMYNIGPVKAEVQKLIEEKKVRIVLNLQDVPFIDSTGIGMVLLFQKNLKDAGGGLKLVKLTPSVEQVFRLTRLIQIVEIFDSDEAAIASFR
ncbi:MAG: STAS domain-containing protein, partial [Turneriella sp.]|nr:STAS domain-containing protein [Turneriella sp.]